MPSETVSDLEPQLREIIDWLLNTRIVGYELKAVQSAGVLQRALDALRSKPVASGADEVIERIGEIVYRRHERGFILWPLVEGDRIKSELREALSLLPKATAPVVSEPVPTAGKNYHDIDDPRLTGLAELMVDAASPQPQQKSVTEGGHSE